MAYEITLLDLDKLMRSNNKGWKNLNDLARILTEQQANNGTTAISISELARRAGLDSSQVSRLVKGRAGFVTQHNGKRTTGVYYLSEFAAYCRNRSTDSNVFYPRLISDLVRVALSAPFNGQVPMQVATKPDVKKNWPKIDTALLANMSAEPEAYIEVPYLITSNEVGFNMVVDFINMPWLRLKADANIAIKKVPEKDLKNLLPFIAEHLRGTASLYDLVKRTIMEKELH